MWFTNITITNNVFKNIVRNNNEAAVHINVDPSEAANGFVFKNNVIDGVGGASNSGLYITTDGSVIIDNNIIRNVAFRPYIIQIANNNGIADSVISTNNVFEASPKGRVQVLGSVATGADNVELILNNNIFKDITETFAICASFVKAK